MSMIFAGKLLVPSSTLASSNNRSTGSSHPKEHNIQRLSTILSSSEGILYSGVDTSNLSSKKRESIALLKSPMSNTSTQPPPDKKSVNDKVSRAMKVLPVFSLPPIIRRVPPKMIMTSDTPNFSLIAIQQHFQQLTPIETNITRKYLHIVLSDWTELNRYFNIEGIFSGDIDSRRSVMATVYHRMFQQSRFVNIREGEFYQPLILSSSSTENLYSSSIPSSSGSHMSSTLPTSHRTMSLTKHKPKKVLGKKGKQQKMESLQSKLQSQLLVSLQNMQTHSLQLKEGILDLPRLVDLKQTRAGMYVHVLGVQRLSKCVDKVMLKQKKIGFQAWSLAILVDRRNKQVKILVQFIKYRILSVKLNKVVRQVMRRALRQWLFIVHKEMLQTRRETENRSAGTIQRVFRGYRACCLLARSAEKQRLERVYEALVRVQAFFRGRLARFNYLHLCRRHLEDTSVGLIQRVLRGYRGRMTAYNRRRDKAMRRGATMFQAAFRGWLVRREVLNMRRRQREHDAAIVIQAIGRGYASRMMVRNIRNQQRRLEALAVLQRAGRGYICRKTLPAKLADIAAYRDKRSKYVLKIQRIYRGFRARIIVRIMAREKKRTGAIKDPAATKINSAARRYLARKIRRQLEKKRYQEWIRDAKAVKEYWSDDYNCWYYYVEDTGESLWEPPKTGYTKNDGQLVLSSGQVIPDPTMFTEDDTGDASTATTLMSVVDTNLCTECLSRVAIRLCLQCGDKFCCPCYKEQHAIGSRQKHKWEPLGPKECCDCEVELAERFCVSCDDAFCDSCWRRVHLKGKRRFHPFSAVDKLGNINPRVFTIDGNEVTTTYDPAFVQQQYEQQVVAVPENHNTTAAAVTTTSRGNDGWSYAYDENGYIYWYNRITGISQYEDPYSSALVTK